MEEVRYELQFKVSREKYQFARHRSPAVCLTLILGIFPAWLTRWNDARESVKSEEYRYCLSDRVAHTVK
jgi:hypothetical protein